MKLRRKPGSGRFVHMLLLLMLGLLGISMAGCGGGGGGGGNGGGGSSSGGYNVQLSTNSISFDYGLNTSVPAAQVMTASFNGDGLVIGIPPGVPYPAWLNVVLVDPVDNTSPVDVRLSVNTALLTTIGTRQTTVRFATGNASGTEVVYKDLSVRCTVTERIELDATQLDFNHTNGAANPDTQAVQVSGNSLDWSAAASESWVTLDTTSGTTPSVINIGVDAGGLAAGIHSATVTVTNTSTHADETLQVNVTVEPHKLFVGDNGVALSSFPTARSMLSHDVMVSENAGVATGWTAVSDSAWLTATGSGVTDGWLTLTADPAGLQTDTVHYATVTVTSSDATIANTEAIQIGFYVSEDDPTASQVDRAAYYMVSDPIRPYVYVTYSGHLSSASNVLDIYNVYNGLNVGSITTGLELRGMTISSDGQTLYVIDAHDDTIIPIDLATLNDGGKWPAADFGSIYAMLEYTRFNGMGVVMTSQKEVFDVRDGAMVATIPYNGLSEIVLAASRDGNSFFGLLRGMSGYVDLDRYAGGYSTVNDAFSVVRTHGLLRNFANAIDIATNWDGSKIYTASGGEYAFPTFNFDGSDMTEGAALAGSSYPVAVVVDPDGTLFGGMDMNSPDIFSYDASGAAGSQYIIPGNLERRQLEISGDGLRLIALTNVINFIDIVP